MNDVDECECGHIRYHHSDTCNYYGYSGEGCDCAGFQLKEEIMTHEEEIQARLDAATPPSWVLGKYGNIVGVAQVRSAEDADLIVNAPDDLNYLLNENESLVDENLELSDSNADLSDANEILRMMVVEMEES